MSYTATIGRLSSVDYTDEKWMPEVISITVCTSLEDNTPQVINLMDTFSEVQTRSNRLQPDEVYWLSERIVDDRKETIQKRLMPLFVLPCADAGFNVKNRGYQNKKSFLYICCRRHKYFHSQKVSPFADHHMMQTCVVQNAWHKMCHT